MEENEDEPVDVQQATPVDTEVKKGGVDEESGKPRESFRYESSKLHKCPEKSIKVKKPVKTKEECCKSKLEKRTKSPKTAKVFIYEKPCTLPKLDVIPRHCLSKQEWMNLLATPSRKCPPCLKKTEERPLRPVSARMNQLALPPRQRMLATLQDRGTILPAELVDKLINVLEAESCLTPEQAENFFRDKPKKISKKSRKDNKEDCTGELEKPEEITIVGSSYNEKAVHCQYSIAETFVKSILQWESTIPKEEFRDIAGVIIKRLENILEYPALEDGDRMTQQMRFLSDIVASWIAGVLLEVAETEKEELEKQCEEVRKAKEEETDEESDDDSEKEIVIQTRRQPRKKKVKKEYNVEDDSDSLKEKMKKERRDDDDDEEGDDSDSLKKEMKKERRNDDDDEEGDDSDFLKKERRNDDDGGGDGGGAPQGTGSARASGASRSESKESSEARESQPQEGEKSGDGVIEDEPQETDDVDTISYADALKKTQIDEKLEDVEDPIESIDQNVSSEATVEDALETPKDSIQPIERRVSRTVTFTDTLGKSKDKDSIKSIDGVVSDGVVSVGAEINDTLGETLIPHDDDTTSELKVTVSEEHSSQISQMKREMMDGDISMAEIPLEEISHSDEPGNDEMKVTYEEPPNTDEAAILSVQASGVGEPMKETSFVGATNVESELSEVKIAEVKKEFVEPPVSELGQGKGYESTGEMVQKESKIIGPPVEPPVSELERKKGYESTDRLVQKGSKVIGPPVSDIKMEKTDEQLDESRYGTRKAEAELLDPSVPSHHQKVPFIEGSNVKKEDRFMPISDFAEALKSDITFMNFLKIFDTIESVVQNEPENIGNDLIIDRLHRTVYEKFAYVVRAETPEKLTEHMKDMLDVLSGKIAIFLRKILTDSQVIFLENNPPQVESGELRESGRWMGDILNMANVWSSWLQIVIQEAANMSTNPTTRGDWQNWTKKVQGEALLYRRFYLESMHKAHHNRTMLSGREVVKTGELKHPDYTIVEREIETTNFWY